ncbi:MAG: M48 family metallopeptidase [Gemmatimonadetes bacterium]|nr:M48 family metallopeptidase [Gemmatimonadota bacterium]
MESTQIVLGDITVEVVRKRVKNINLTVQPPLGRVRISAPKRASLKTIRAFAISKLDWIRKQQAWMREQARQAPPAGPRVELKYIDGESHEVWGKPCLLAVSERVGPPSVELNHDRLLLQVRPRTPREGRRALVETWYREQVRTAVPPLLERWEPRLGVKVERFQVRRMKTRWGSCTPAKRTIRLNTELATRSPELLEYIVVHELVHLLEANHNARFYELMDLHMPGWQAHRKELSREPVRAEVRRVEQGELGL